MKLLSLRAKNFRQFKGTTPEITFAAPGDHPITIFFGTNGSGKTALLNAFTWTLYGQTSRGFLLPEQVINNAALREAAPGDEVEGWVRISFEHLSYKYIIQRTSRVRRGATEADVSQLGDAVTELQFAGPDGQWKVDPSVVDAIGRILPEDLHTYFFFDGERIERLVQPREEDRADIANATKKLFSLEILDRAIRHVSSAKKSLEDEYRKIGDAQVVQQIEAKRAIEAELQAKSERLRELEKNIESHKKASEEIEGRLRTLRAAQDIQERRDGLKADKESRTKSLSLATDEASLLVSSRAYSIFLSDACWTYREVVESMRKRGELPAGIKKQFVEDLLSRNLCICGRSLHHDDAPEPRQVVEGWRSRAGPLSTLRKRQSAWAEKCVSSNFRCCNFGNSSITY